MSSTTDAPPVPAIGYVRVSMAREEMISPEIQEAAIRDWARRHNRHVLRIIPDLDKSGRNFKRRVQEAVEAVEGGEAREIIVWKFSRFGRQRLGWAVHLDLVESAGGDLVSATEEVDARTASGRFARGMLAEVAAFESDRASEQWIEAMEHRQSRGLTKHGGPRWGYIRKGRVRRPDDPHRYMADLSDPLGERYEPDPDLREVYRSMYERFVRGEGGPTLVTWLNCRGYRTVRGSEWTVQTFYAVMDSGFAAGLIREHPRDCDCGQSARCWNSVYHQGTHEAVISMELWEAYLARRRARRVTPVRARHPRYPLSGLMYCACGARMTTVSGTVPGNGYRCSRYRQVPECTGAYVRRAYAEEVVLGELARWSEEIEAEAARATPAEPAVVVAARPDIEALAAAVTKIDRALVRLRKAHALDEDDDDQAEREYQEARAELVGERDAAAARLAEAQAEPEPEPTREELGSVIDGLLEGWDALAPGEQQLLLRSVVRAVRVTRTGRRTLPRVEVVPAWDDD